MERLWSDAEAAYRAKILDALGPQPSARLLDVGCDDGEWTEAVRRSLAVPSDRVAGLEIVEERAELARAHGFDVRSGDLNDDWPFEDGSFDVVHANQVIEHVIRLDHFVEEMRRVLRPRGRAIVCTENLASWHNVGALALGYQPFSLTNISARRPIGNPSRCTRASRRPSNRGNTCMSYLWLDSVTSSRRTDLRLRRVGALATTRFRIRLRPGSQR